MECNKKCLGFSALLKFCTYNFSSRYYLKSLKYMFSLGLVRHVYYNFKYLVIASKSFDK